MRYETMRSIVAGTMLWAALVAGPARAASTRSWSASTTEEFSRGTLEGTALDEEGRVRLALGIDTLWGPAEGVVWKIAPDRGGGAFVALSSPGRVLHLDSRGRAETWFEAGGEDLVAAAVADAAGGVYFGLSPSGEVRHANAAGVHEVVAETGARFIWALDVAADGSLWIGEGIPGRIQRLTPDRSLSTVFETGDDPVRVVVARPGGEVLVGTGGAGRVLRLDAEGRPSVMLDAEEPEIVDLVVDARGTLFVLAARGSKQVRAAQRAKTAAAESATDETVRVVASPPPGDDGDDDEPARGEPQGAPPRIPSTRRSGAPGGAVLYRVDPGQGGRSIWSAAREMPFALAVAPDGRLLVATGDLGRVHSLDDRGQTSMVLEIPSDQASALATAPDGRVWIGGTSDARVARLGREGLDAGDYLSEPVDAGSVAQWGRLSWEADVPRGARLEVSVRGGNTDDPDATWSPWVDLEAGGAGGSVAAGATRWFQARIRLRASSRGESPLLRRLEVFFVPANRPPKIASLTVQPAGIVWTHAQTTPVRPRGPVVADDPITRNATKSLEGRSSNPVRKLYELGARTASWSAEDPDGDDLTYSLEIRREGSEAWLLLASDVEDSFLGWDARRFPDGLYRIRLTADDSRDNPAGRQHADRQTSPIFRVDNTRPSLAAPRIRREGQTFTVEFTAADPGGNVAAVEFAIDGGRWQPVDPVDGVADSEEERFRMRIDADGGRTPVRSIHVRVTDGAGNVGGDGWALGEPADRPRAVDQRGAESIDTRSIETSAGSPNSTPR